MPNETALIFKKSLEETIEEGIEMTKGQISENAKINLEKYKSIAWETVDNSYYGGKYLVFVSSRSVKMRGFSFLSLHAF